MDLFVGHVGEERTKDGIVDELNVATSEVKVTDSTEIPPESFINELLFIPETHSGYNVDILDLSERTTFSLIPALIAKPLSKQLILRYMSPLVLTAHI